MNAKPVDAGHPYMRRALDMFYHEDVQISPNATSKFVREFARQLTRHFDVTLFVYTDGKFVTDSTIDGYRIIRVPRPFISKFGRTPQLKRIFDALSAFSPRAYFQSMRKNRADYILVVDSYSGLVTCLMGKVSGKKIIFRPNDCLVTLGAQVLKHQSVLMGGIMVCYGLLVERLLTRVSDLVVMPSKKVLERFDELYGVGRKSVVCYYGFKVQPDPLPEDREHLRRRLGVADDKFVIIFLGIGGWIPNDLAISYIINKLAPTVAGTLPNALFLIVGRNTEIFRHPTNPTNLRVIGEVPTVEPYIEASDIGIAPLVIGGGVSSKLIDYLWYGLPSLATDEAAGTLEPQKGLYTTTLADFPKAILTLSNNKEVLQSRREISSSARKNYAFDSMVKSVGDKIDDLL